MAIKQPKNWQEVQAFLDSGDLATQVQMAQLLKIEVPPEVLAQLEAEKADREVIINFGSKRSPDKVYLTFDQGSPTGDKTKTGAPSVGSAPYMEIRVLDAEILRLTAARDRLRAAGLPTGPCPKEKLPTLEQVKAAGFAVKDNRVQK